MTELPRGTVTFLFTDIEGSTRLWEEHPDAMQPALALHDEIVGAAIATHDGPATSSSPSRSRCSVIRRRRRGSQPGPQVRSEGLLDTTPWSMAQRVAVARVDVPIFV